MERMKEQGRKEGNKGKKLAVFGIWEKEAKGKDLQCCVLIYKETKGRRGEREE